MITVENLAERLDWLESVETLRRVVAEYAHGADRRDLVQFLAVFHPDAVWDVGSTRFEGHDQIRGAIERQWNNQPEMRHWTTNVTLTRTGAHTASGSSDVAVLTQLADGRSLLSAGGYHDRFERRSNVWALIERRAMVFRTVHLAERAAGEPLRDRSSS